MKVTKKGFVHIHITDEEADGCLQQGGVCGRVEAYHVGDVCRVTGIPAGDIEDYDEDSPAPSASCCTVAEIVRFHLIPVRIVRKGVKIE